MASGNLSIYAELLPSIRQVSVATSLPVEPGAATHAQVFAGGSRVGIRHGTSAKDLLLPGVVTAPPLLPIPKALSRSLSWRLPLAASHTSLAALAHDHYPTPPWSSADLKPGSLVTCRHCGNAVLPAGVISTWKDLPSENWAEMMEFWHCHKPEPLSHQNHEHLADRGYGANAGISAQDAVGFIDIMSFIFTEHDTVGLRYSAQPNAQPGSAQPQDGDMPRTQSASCAQCDSVIGLRETYKHSIRLFKWQVGCQTLRPVKIPSATECLAAALMATLSRSGSAKVVVLPISAGEAPGSSETVLHLWILNSNITYASTEAAGELRTAIKLFYRTISRVEADRLLDPMASDIQDLTLAEGALRETIRQLEATNHFLPEEQRRHQNWKVGLLDRYENNRL